MTHEQFAYRIAYGCWLNDSRTEPIVDESWPSIRIDEHTLESLDMTMDFLHSAGYNAFDVFGLLTNNNWTQDIVSTVDEKRKSQVRQVIDIVHRHDLKLIYGLGVYSWGFDDYIAHNSEVRGTSKQAMCASSPAAEKVMYKVIDFVVDNFAIDGFHLEAADQGRCVCDKCRKYDDVEYFNRINLLVANYIRNRWPDKVLLMNTSGYLAWGDTFSKEELDSLVPLCNTIDVFIDVGSHGYFVDTSDRKDFIRSIDASFGTANGFWIYPPQRWNRLRWFVPHLQQNHWNLKEVFAAGGTSCELYLAPLINPGVEMTILCNGLFLQNPVRSIDEILNEGIGMLYGELNGDDQRFLASIFKDAENYFFNSFNPIRNRSVEETYSDGVERIFSWSKNHPELAVPGELFLERLFGLGAGYPCYLTVHFDSEGRQTYYESMKSLLVRAVDIAKRNPKCVRLQRIVEAIEATIDDIILVMEDFDSSSK